MYNMIKLNKFWNRPAKDTDDEKENSVVVDDRMELRNFHYKNEKKIDDDFSFITNSLITEISHRKIKELEIEVGGKVSLGPILKWLTLDALDLGINADLRKKSINEQEVKMQLGAANKLAIIERTLRKRGKLLSMSLLDSSSSIDEKNLVKRLRSSEYCLLSGKFTVSQDSIEGRTWILFSIGLESNIILIPASPEFMTDMRAVYFLQHTKPSLSAFCYYDESNSDSDEQPPITHIFAPRAIWNYRSA
jgi:hypothetical protein